MIEVFKKMWPDAWGVRMEHILRNVLIALLEQPNATLHDVLRLFSDKQGRQALHGGAHHSHGKLPCQPMEGVLRPLTVPLTAKATRSTFFVARLTFFDHRRAALDSSRRISFAISKPRHARGFFHSRQLLRIRPADGGLKANLISAASQAHPFPNRRRRSRPDGPSASTGP
jgi:hypothetical protein